MRQQPHSIKLPHSLVYPSLHPAIVHKNNGLFCITPIPANTLLISCLSQEIISIKTVPIFIKQIPRMDDNERIALYVLLLKNCDTESMSKQLKEWLSCKTMGFISLQDKVMRQCGDEQMLIQYSAYKFHYKQEATKLYQLEPIKHLLQKYTPISTLSQFTQQWIQACQFKNTRSFGHTDEYLIIPAIDYLNYDPAFDCGKVKFITFDHQQQIQDNLLRDQTQDQAQQSKQQQEQLNETDSDEQQQVQEKTKKYVGIYSVKPIGPGEEILFDYGGLSNYQLFRHYGYAVRNNPHDYVTIYLSNYYKENPIYFSAIQRCTTKYKLYGNKINKKFVEHWIRIYSTKNTCDRSEKIKNLIMCMKNNTPPHFQQHQFQQLSSLNGFKYFVIYQQEQSRIFHQNIGLLIAVVQQNRPVIQEELVRKSLE